MAAANHLCSRFLKCINCNWLQSRKVSPLVAWPSGDAWRMGMGSRYLKRGTNVALGRDWSRGPSLEYLLYPEMKCWIFPPSSIRARMVQMEFVYYTVVRTSNGMNLLILFTLQYYSCTPLAVVSRARKSIRVSTPLLQIAQIPDVSTKDGAVIGAVFSTRKLQLTSDTWIISE
jgi:hypothetical protein